jgi:hypothetical protein
MQDGHKSCVDTCSHSYLLSFVISYDLQWLTYLNPS